MPAKVPLEDAVFNVGRTALLVGALTTGTTSFLATALQDRLHQPYRKQLIKGMEDVFHAAVKASARAVISGAGPCLMAYAVSNENNIGDSMVTAFAKHGVKAYYLALDIDTGGANVY